MILLALAFHASATEIVEGPNVHFERHSSELCAHYTLDEHYDLYRNKIFARTDRHGLALSGLPRGELKIIAGMPETVMSQGIFKICVSADSDSSSLFWIDQSCLSQQGICLPPRAFEINRLSQVKLLSPSTAGRLFTQSLSEQASPHSPAPLRDEWTIPFFPNK